MVFFWTAVLLLLVLPMLILVATATWRGYRVLGLSTDVNSGDVDDSFALTYVVTRGFFVDGKLSFALAFLRWFVPLLQPYTIRIALESKGDLKLLVEQMNAHMYGRVSRVEGGFLSTNFELIELYQSGYKVVFPNVIYPNYELVSVGADLDVDLLEIAGPTSCLFNTACDLLYVGRLSLRGQNVVTMTGANAGELGRQCVEKALRNGAKVRELPVQFSRSILCSLPHSSPLLATAAQLQLNPWAFSFLQNGPAAQQFAESNRETGALLLSKMGLTYESVWEKLDSGVQRRVEALAAKFSHWEPSTARDRILWAVVNFGGRFPWVKDSHTSLNPPFNELWSILDTEKMDPLELLEFRVANVSRFAGLEEERVRRVLSHAVLYDLYAVVLLKCRLSPETVATNPDLLTWFKNDVQAFVDSIPNSYLSAS